jgi:hypothetical protein
MCNDAGTSPTVPGSGKNGDQGTGMLILVRIDRGTANIADSLTALVKSWIDAVDGAGFKTSSVAVGDLYGGNLIWATRLGQQPSAALLDSLRLAASLAAGSPSTCTTAGLSNAGRSLSALQATGVQPFSPTPGAFLTVLIDTGPRPVALLSCPNDSLFGSDPASWAVFYTGVLPRAVTRFAFVSSSETESLDQMRTRCLATSGFPPSAADSLAPSNTAFFLPLTAGLDARSANLGVVIDVCAALGTSEPSFTEFVKQWYASLAAPH